MRSVVGEEAEDPKGRGRGVVESVKSTSRLRGVVHSWITERGWGR